MRYAASLAALLATALMATAAHAALGHAVESVQTDRVHMSARMATAASAAYTAQTLTLDNGGTIKELSSGGVVFAVAWRGPSRPDLKQLLGEHFDTLQAETAVVGAHRLRAPILLNRADLVVHSAGHPGAFRGFAYLPALTPAGVSAADLQ
jgi:hypothetical protein